MSGAGFGPCRRADHGFVVGNGRTPHWFIWYFGSDPNCAGQGHGGALMEKVLEELKVLEAYRNTLFGETRQQALLAKQQADAYAKQAADAARARC